VKPARPARENVTKLSQNALFAPGETTATISFSTTLTTPTSFSKGLSCRYPAVECRAYHEPQYPPLQSTSSSVVNPHDPAVAGSAPPPNNFPSVFYLDWNVFQRCQVEIPKPILPLPPKISTIIGDAEKWEIIAAEYFATTHT